MQPINMYVVREMHPFIPGREDAFHELSTREIYSPPPPISVFKNLIEFLLLERRKFILVIHTSQTF